MIVRLRLSRLARSDIKSIFKYLNEARPGGALRMKQRFSRAFLLLSEQPRSGRKRISLGKNMRSFPALPYMIYYEIRTAEVLAVRVLHGARDAEAILREP